MNNGTWDSVVKHINYFHRVAAPEAGTRLPLIDIIRLGIFRQW